MSAMKLQYDTCTAMYPRPRAEILRKVLLTDRYETTAVLLEVPTGILSRYYLSSVVRLSGSIVWAANVTSDHAQWDDECASFGIANPIRLWKKLSKHE